MTMKDDLASLIERASEPYDRSSHRYRVKMTISNHKFLRRLDAARQGEDHHGRD